MALFEKQLGEPTSGQVRQFAVLCALLLPAIGWWWSASSTVMYALTVVGLTILGTSFVVPKIAAMLFKLVTAITLPIGMVVGEVALLMIFVLVFLPISVVFRILGRNRLQLGFERTQKSYWQTKRPAKSAAQYYRQS
jgi:hypothetical protein